MSASKDYLFGDDEPKMAEKIVDCSGCNCTMLIKAFGEDKPGFKWHDTARCHCGNDLGTPYSNPFSIHAEILQKRCDIITPE